MEQKELIIAVIRKYESAQEISTDIPAGERPHLRRATKHVVSSYLEDITTTFIADILPPESFDVWIDQTFYFRDSKSQFRPDIAVVKKGTPDAIVGFVEVKDSPNPFRWKSKNDQNRGIEYVNERQQLLLSFRGNVLRYSLGRGRKPVEILVSTSAKFDLVLFSDHLFNIKKLTALKDACDGEYVHLHLLLKGHHPNVKHKNYSAEQLTNKIEKDDPEGIYDESTLRNRIQEIQQL